MSTEEPGWGGYTEPTRDNGGGGSKPPTPQPPSQPNQWGELPGGATVSEGSDPGDNYGYSSGGNDLSGGSHTSYDNAGNPTTIYTDRLGNVHSLQDYSGRGGGRYDTVIGGFHEGYAGSGYRRSAYTELQQPGVRTAVLAAANADPGAALRLERAGIIEIQRSQPEQIENYPGNNGPRFETPFNRHLGYNPDFVYKPSPRPPLQTELPQQEQSQEKQDMSFWDKISSEYENINSKISSRTTPFLNEVQALREYGQEYAPKHYPNTYKPTEADKIAYDFQTGMLESIRDRPADAIVSAATMAILSPIAAKLPTIVNYGIAGYYGYDVEQRISGSNNPANTAGGIFATEIVPMAAGGAIGNALKDPLVDISNRGIGKVQDIIGKTEGVKKNSFNEEIYMSRKEPNPKPIFEELTPDDIISGKKPEIIGYESLPPEGNIKVEIAGGKVEANRLIDNIASGLKASGDNIKVKGSEIFSDNGLYVKENKIVEIDYFNKFKEETLGPKKFRQPEINNLETKDITAMPFENVNLNVGDIRPAQTGLESLKQVSKPSLEGLKQVHKGSLEGLKPVEKKGFEGLKKVKKPGLASLVKEKMVSSAVSLTEDLPIKFVDVSPGKTPVYRGLSLEVGRTGQPLIGKTPEGWKIGTPEFNEAQVKELYGEAFDNPAGYPANTPTELAIARKNIINNYDPLNKAIAEDSMQLREMTFGTESRFLSEELVFDEPLKAHGLKPETIKNVKKWFDNQDTVVAGSVAQKSQMRGLPHRELHDIDFYIENPQAKAAELLDLIEKTDPGKVYLKTPGGHQLITKEGGTIFDVKPPEGLVDLVPEALGSPGYQRAAEKYVHFAFKYEDPVKIGGIKATSLSEQATRKMGSTIGLRENEVRPDMVRRVKDIADYLTIEPALIESQKMGLFSGLRAGKIARERTILSRLEQNWMEKVKSFTPEQRAKFFDTLGENRPDLKQVIYVSKSLRPKSDSASLSKMAGVGAFESRNNNIVSQYKIDKSIRESSMMKNLEKSSGSKSSGGSRSKSGGGSKSSSFGIKPSGSVFGSGGSNSHGSSPPSSPPGRSPGGGSGGNSSGRSGGGGGGSGGDSSGSSGGRSGGGGGGGFGWPTGKPLKMKPHQDDMRSIQKAIKKSFRTVRIAPIMEPIAFGQKGRGKRRRR
ncbi:MAG: hypothetical protein OIN84_20585 [Candidatus Methanoperedens sp.]|nr:hypothetical protein [Candidatus Methanoperedens sp. BLZ2]MBZ0176646.1 hypothetical protein [Candidatus Methanoperedens nitroreducens]MCX9080370.1 hypothetical protein [Candidatus Methanoperedens sp.]